MTIDYMREKIREPYPYPKWQEKVDSMTDAQVIAIYFKFKDTGLFDRKKKKAEKEQYHQMTLWDYL